MKTTTMGAKPETAAKNIRSLRPAARRGSRDVFSPADRILACEQCGAPVFMPVEGGTAECDACGSPLSAPPRPDTRVLRLTPIPEEQRIARLERQVGDERNPAPGLENIISDGGIEEWRMSEARVIWGQIRRRLLDDPTDIAAAERLLSLTDALTNELWGSEDLQYRAVSEGALEVLTLPRHRQLIRTFLARRAARTGEVENARSWLDGCDPLSDDLLGDTGYRMSLALIATARGEFATVLETLGRDDGDVPLEEEEQSYAMFCVRTPLKSWAIWMRHAHSSNST